MSTPISKYDSFFFYISLFKLKQSSLSIFMNMCSNCRQIMTKLTTDRCVKGPPHFGKSSENSPSIRNTFLKKNFIYIVPI